MFGSFLGDRTVLIGRAVARAPGARAGDARLDLDRITAAIDFGNAHTRAGAIVVLRSVRCRVAGELRALAREPRALASAVRSTQAALRRAASRAVRASAADARGADCIYFADLAELIACLARDCAAGRVHEQWWWRSLLRGMPPSEYLVTLCVSHPQFVPAAFERLATTFDAVTFAREVVAGEASRVVAAVSRAFSLPLAVDGVGSLSRLRHETGARDMSRLAAALPECRHGGLTEPQVLLVALALGLRRVPEEVRSARFAAFVADAVETPRPLHVSSGFGADELRREGRPVQATASADLALERPRQRRADVRRAPRPRIASARTVAGTSAAPPDRMRDGHGAIHESSAPREMRPAALLAEASAASHEGPVDAAKTRIPFGPQHPTAPPPTLRCVTRFGGIFYMLNVALCLGLYGDFTRPRTGGIALSPWDLLSVLGRRWFGERFERDAVCLFLARLAGRDEGAALREPRWMKRLAPRIEARIALGLGERRVWRAIVRVSCADARVVDTGTRLDVHFDLAKLPLPVRFAGLDRDPGWIPAAGRIVAFHFD